MVDSFISCFASNPIIVSDDIFIKWNNDNHSGVILNVDDSCLGTPLRASYGGVIRNDAGVYLSGFLDIFLTHLTSCIMNFMLSTRAKFWQET